MRINKEKNLTLLHVLIFSILIIIITVAVAIFSRFDHNPKSYEFKGEAMKTNVQQTVYGENGEVAASEAFLQIKRLDNMTSWKNPDSEIFEINKYSGQNWVDVSERVLKILTVCVDVANKTEGAFDPTILPLELLWDFDKEGFSPPSDTEINDAKENVDYKNLKVNNDVKRAKLFNNKSGISLDSVSHGLACDRAIQTYQKMGVKSGVIVVGKSVGVYGKKPSGKAWNIAVQDPLKSSDELLSLAVIKVNSGCVSTCYKSDNSNKDVPYNRVIDPRTGNPVENNIMSVTVVHESGLICDVLARACCVLGKENSLYILNYYGANAMFVDEDKNIFLSSKLKDNVAVNNKSYAVKDTF